MADQKHIYFYSLFLKPSSHVFVALSVHVVILFTIKVNAGIREYMNEKMKRRSRVCYLVGVSFNSISLKLPLILTSLNQLS